MGVSEFFLAFVFGIHIVMVNIGIALATLIPYLEWKSLKLGDSKLLENAKRLFKIYAATYGVAGVFGTAYTVFLLSYYPEFIGVAGSITLYPFGIAILFIALHFLCIVTYWYGWGRFSDSTHLFIGGLLAFSAYMIPFGFRAVFAFLNIPAGLEILGPSKLGLNLAAALANPTFLPLYLKTITGALITGFLFVAAIYAYKKYRGELSDPKYEEELILKPAKTSFYLLMLQVLFGLWYIHSLTNVPYKFNNIFAALGMKIPGPGPALDLSWLFILKMIFVAVQFVALTYVVKKCKTGITPKGVEMVKLAAASAILGLLSSEYLNAFSQYPYFVAALPQIADKVPEPWRTVLARALDLRKVNMFASDPGLVVFTAVFLALLLAATLYFVYIVFLKENGKNK